MPILKPAQGLTVLDPETRLPLAPEGEDKPLSSYWIRRLQDGDVVEVVAAPQPAAPKEASK